MTTLAGLPRTYGTSEGTGDAARFREVTGVAVDPTGKLFVADTGNAAIRVGVGPLPAITSPLTATTVIGQYTAIVSGKGNATGVALVEVYSLQ